MLLSQTAPRPKPGRRTYVYKHIGSVFIVLTFLGLGLPSCKRAQTVGANLTRPTNAAPKIDACSLITKEDVGTTQGTTIVDTKSSESFDGQHLITQCYYASTGPNLSVSVALTQPNPGSDNASGPRQYWEQIFGKYRTSQPGETEREEANEKHKEPERRGEGEEEERKTPPKKVDGVGDEAFWSGSRVGGALYVLHKDYILRISIGGPHSEETRIKKSQVLAQKALERL